MILTHLLFYILIFQYIFLVEDIVFLQRAVKRPEQEHARLSLSPPQIHIKYFLEKNILCHMYFLYVFKTVVNVPWTLQHSNIYSLYIMLTGHNKRPGS